MDKTFGQADPRLRAYIANARMEMHFRPTSTDAFQVVTENRFFADAGTVEWEELSFSVNGTKWGPDRPAFPLLQAEKVLSPPLDLRLDADYRYRLDGTEPIDGAPCYVVRFTPNPASTAKSLYQGTVWIDRQTFRRRKLQAIQTGLGAPVVSNDETVRFAAAGTVDGRDVFLPVETSLVAQIAVDASASMAYAGSGPVSKLDYARLIAAALAHLIANQGDATGLVIFDDRIRQYLPSRIGQAQLRGLLVALARMQASGATTGGLALRRATDLLKRRGLLLVISDLYDEDDSVEQELRRAVTIGHEVAVFHILTRDEVDFPFGGEFEMQDLESGRTVLAGQASVDAYHREFGAFLDRWQTRCTRYGIDYARVTTDMPLDQVLRGYLLRRSRGPVR